MDSARKGNCSCGKTFMWQVTYNPSVVVAFPAVTLKGDGTRIQAPLLADGCMDRSIGIAREKLEIFSFCRPANILFTVKKQDCFIG